MTAPPVRFIDPRHGPHAPTHGSPRRRPGSVRRTTTVDARRPAGWAGVQLTGRGRDCVTRIDGSPSIAATTTADVTIAYTAGPVVERVACEPPVEGLEALVGRVASSGFRAVIDSSVAVERGSLTYLLLDEIPASTLVSGYAVGHAAANGAPASVSTERMRPPGPRLQVSDLCAGWQAGGVIMSSLDADGRPPLVTGPDAPVFDDPDDPLSWHATERLGPHEMRRARRCDVWRASDDMLRVDAFFRDSHMDAGGVETVVHEYTVDATIAADASTVLTCRATARVLPWLECPQAAASAGRLAGMPVHGLRKQVRNDLVGNTTCTHLNDMLRQLEDVASLARLLP